MKIDEGCLLPAAEVIDPWNVRIEWQWTGLLSDKTVHNVIMTPVIGNLTDGDGDVDTDDVPNVVFAAFAGSGLTSGTLVVLDGRDGRELWSKPGWHGSGGIALADIDSDGLTDIVGFDTQARPMAADHIRPRWRSPGRGRHDRWGPSGHLRPRRCPESAGERRNGATRGALRR